MSSTSGTFLHSLSHNWLGKADIAVQSVLLAGGFIAVALRIWSRRLLGASWQVNDWLILAALMVMLGRYVVELLLVLLCGLGLHTEIVFAIGGSDAVVRFKKITYAGDLLWITVVGLVQLSILHFYLRQFQHRIIILFTYITVALCTSLWIGSFFATAFICTPPEKIWLPDIDGDCRNQKTLRLATTIAEGVLESFIICLPLPTLAHLPLSGTKKAATSFIYLLGLIIIATTLIRIKADSYLNEDDITYSSARKSLLSCVVPLLGIIVACLPIIPPSIQTISGRHVFSPPSADTAAYGYRHSGYYKTTVLSGAQMEDPEIPLVSVRQPPMAKRLSEWCQGQIKITSDWEIHSTRNSARMDKDSIRRA